MGVNLYNLTELRTTTDDAVAATLAETDLQRSHFYADVRLALGYVAVISAAAAGYHDWKVGFEAAKAYTLVGVLLYFAAYGGMVGWQWFIERGMFYEGRRGTQLIQLRSTTSKTEPVYKLQITVKDKSSARPRTTHHQELFTKWFDVDGNIVKEPLATWVSSIVQSVLASNKKAK
ncbi:Signal peptidase complex subunit 2 [Savitreella phatthalungensis]